MTKESLGLGTGFKTLLGGARQMIVSDDGVLEVSLLYE